MATNEKGGGPRWRRMPDDRRQAILAAALTEFDAKGLQGAKMDHVALAAGLSKGSVYRYFPDKFSLFSQAIAAALDESLSQGGGGALQDRQLFLRRIWLAFNNPRFQAAYRLSQVRDPALPGLAEHTASRIENSVVKPLAELLGQTEREATLPQDDPRERARLAVSTLLGAALMNTNTPDSRDAAVAFLLRACELDTLSPQADGF